MILDDNIGGMPPELIPYNTGMPRIGMTEYGRSVQDLVAYCKTIDDRDERLRCARSIIKVMKKLAPKESQGDEAKLWDHLNILSGFGLDIDWPFEVVTPEAMDVRPRKIPYSSNNVASRVYGNNVTRLIEKAAAMEEGDERDALVYALANQMKKFMTIGNAETATDSRIFHDIEMMSRGAIVPDPSRFRLNDYVAPAAEGKSKSKKKKR